MKPNRLTKDFRPTPEQIKAAKAVFTAMALIETIKPVVEAYQKECFAKVTLISRITKERITDFKYAYEAEEGAELTRYYALMDQAVIDNGFKVKVKGNCPLLEAESLLRDARRLLVLVMEPVTGISWDDLMMKFSVFEKYIELNLKLLAPFVK